MKIIKDKQIVDDNWHHISDEDDIPSGDVIISYTRWKEQQAALAGHDGRIAICVAGDDETEEVAEVAEQFEMIAIDFPTFRDGRGYSHARLLRDRFDFKGELRAVGDIMRDQLLFLARSGFNAFAVREDKDIEDALNAFGEFSAFYQTAADGQVPIFRQR